MLARIDPDDPEALRRLRAFGPEFVSDIDSRGKWRRIIAVDALGRMVKEFDGALPALERATHDKSPEVRKLADEALKRTKVGR